MVEEIDQAPPKTRIALLDAMQTGSVTVGGQTYRLPEPFHVVATLNPNNPNDAYPFTNAQLDQFLFHLRLNYPSRADEIQIMKASGSTRAELTHVADARQIAAFQQVVRRMLVGDHVFAYVADLVRASRPKEAGAAKWVNDWVNWGAGPRASQSLILSAKTWAAMAGRVHVTTDDIRASVLSVLRHRIKPTPRAEADGLTPDAIIKKLIDSVPVPTKRA
ncbi:MoxR protein [Fimbriiglobus ruber]|uniref:MoxR protein n=2 Tax=Fimbriiglobus ruber TaxID=1908690 RepID=A0A225E0V9_9BACT|nr:MoxR protein [Fimbriiglobus ruber]